jgi:phenylpropionate dioxygenase-like ring-hydroxylating dioxygenase large terminal subunit
MYPLADGLIAARNQWYIAAWSKEVTRTPMERWIANQPVAFYRTEAGEAVAVGGRCPHRHFPLGKGRVVGDAIECLYHGFTFDRSGKCVHIPTQQQVPAVCRIPSYPLVERWEWLWIWPGDPEKADPGLIPDHRELGLLDPAYSATGGVYYPVPGRYTLMHDNLLDLSHLGYLHRSTIASDGIAEAEEVRDEGSGWLRSTRKMPNVSCPPIFAQFLHHEGRVDRAFGMKWYMPALHAGFDNFHEVAAKACTGRLLGAIKVFHAITPGRLNDAHYFFGMARTFAKDNAAVGEAFINGLRVTLVEDMSATREIETMLGSLPEMPQEILVRGDTHCVRGRRMLENMIRAEQSMAT